MSYELSVISYENYGFKSPVRGEILVKNGNKTPLKAPLGAQFA